MVPFGELTRDMKIEHVGIAVKNVDEAIKLFEDKLGGQLLSKSTLESEKMISARVKLGQITFELMEPTSPEGAVGKFIEKRGEGIHHLSIQVSNLDEVVLAYQEKGIEIVGVSSGEGYRVAFIHPRSLFGLLVELSELTA